MIEEFLRVIVHDISNPLMTSQLAIKLMNRKIELKQFETLHLDLKKIEGAYESIESIIGKAKSLLASEQDEVLLETKVVDLEEASRAVVESQRDILAKKDIHVSLISANPGTRVYCDPLILKVVLLGNILSNTIKFSSNGQAVHWGIHNDGTYGVVEIQDFGVGMRADKIQSLMSTGRIESALGTEGEKGTGFGLPLVKRFTEQMKGVFEIESVSEQQHRGFSGTTIRIRLPLAPGVVIEA